MSSAVLDRVHARPQVRSALAALADLHERTAPRPEQALVLTGFDPLDEVLGGGIRPGEVVLLGRLHDVPTPANERVQLEAHRRMRGTSR